MEETTDLLEQKILKLLAIKELYALTLLEVLNSTREKKLSIGNLYPILGRLEKSGLITSRMESGVYPPRKLYKTKQQIS